MGNIRNSTKNGGVVLSEEEKNRIGEIMKSSNQSKIDDIIKNNKKEEKGEKLRGYLTKSKNPQQKIVDEMIKKEREEI